MVKLAFYKGPGDLFDKGIRLWTWGTYSHVEVMIDDVAFSSFPGVGTRYLLYPYFKPQDWDYVEIPMDSVAQAHLHSWCMSEMHCDYDWAGVWLCQVLGLTRQSKTKWFCSEFCTQALRIAGLYKELTPHKMSPNGLYRYVTRHPTVNK